jgi:hypothetical protein
VANFRYVLVLSGRAFVIREEGGNVIQRQSRMPDQPGSAIAKSSRHDSIDDENIARDQQPQPETEIERPAAITLEEDVKRVLVHAHERVNPPSQPEFTISREIHPGGNGRSDVFDSRFIPAAVIVLSFILWRAVRWELRKSKSKIDAKARTNQRTERPGERKKHNNGKRSHTFACRSARGRWTRHGPTGFRMKSKAQWGGAEEQVGLEWRWQELREAARESEADYRWQREREQSTNWQSEETAWWSVLEVSPAAGKDEIVRSYRRKIQRCHPDRVCGLAPEFVLLAETHTKTLNDAYAQAMLARKEGVPSACGPA